MLPEPGLAIRLTEPRPPPVGSRRPESGGGGKPRRERPRPGSGPAQVSVLVRLGAWACGQTDVPRQGEASLALRHPACELLAFAPILESESSLQGCYSTSFTCRPAAGGKWALAGQPTPPTSPVAGRTCTKKRMHTRMPHQLCRLYRSA